MVILKMKVIKSDYKIDDACKDMYKKYYTTFEKLSEKSGGTFIIVRNHYPVVYYCNKTEIFEYEVETGNWGSSFPYIIIAPDWNEDKLYLRVSLNNKQDYINTKVNWKTEKDINEIIKTFKKAIVEIKTYNIDNKKKDIEKDFCEENKNG